MGTKLKNSIFICLFVIATVAFQQSLAQNETIEWRRFKRATSNSEIEKTTKETELRPFLIGEDTPIFVAHGNSDGNFRIGRYPGSYNSTQLSVRSAMDILSIDQQRINYTYFYYLYDSKTYYDIDWRFTYYYNEAYKDYWSYGDAKVGCSASTGCGNSDAEKGVPNDGLKRIYISPLVILDMQAIPDTTRGDQLLHFTKRVTYIMAFWNKVKIELNNLIKSTEVIIRIAAIVAGEKKDSFALWTGGNKPTLNDALDKMKDSLSTPTWTKVFPRNSYDFAVLMTSQSIGGGSPYIPKGASKWRMPCLDRDHPIEDIVIWDNLGFMGVEGAVQELINVLGPAKLEAPINLIPRTAWKQGIHLRPNECSIRRVDAFLPYAWCLDKPKSYFPPGKPVKSLLPGEMMLPNQYCGSLGYGTGVSSASLVSCSDFQCWTYPRAFPVWTSVGRALDGTKCSEKGSVCMDGQCVTNKWKELD